MYRKLEDFFSSYKTLSEGTAGLLARLTDNSLLQPVTDGHRTLGEVAWHLVVTTPEMMSQTGLTLSAIDHTAMPPEAASEFVSAYERASGELVNAIRESWTDESLQEEDEMYGALWKRGDTLRILENHEIHHRAQITILMRQAGLSVPGLFGPSKEEWTQYGMELPSY